MIRCYTSAGAVWHYFNMDLFKIERYGDEKPATSEKNEDIQMQLLLKRIEERRKKHSQSTKRKHSGDVLEAKNKRIEHTEIKSIKKRTKDKVSKLCPSTVCDVVNERLGVTVENSEAIIGTPRKKRKKKTSPLDTAVNETSLGESRDIVAKCSEEKRRNKSKTCSDSIIDEEFLIADAQENGVYVHANSDSNDSSKLNVESVTDGELDADQGKQNDSVAAGKERIESSFQVLGRQKRKRKESVRRTLPCWLSEPILVSASINSAKEPISDISYLSSTTVGKLRQAKLTHLFPIQASVVPFLVSQTEEDSILGKAGLPPRDICVQAPTGSGKTLSYVLPLVEILSRTIVRQLYALVILPSKDLAAQVKKVFDIYAQGTRLKVALVSGLNTFPKEQEKLVVKCLDRYLSKVDIIVCTPGRLVDHIKHTAGFSLSQLRFLVVDEADRLLSEAYSNWIEEVIKGSFVNSPSCLLQRSLHTPGNASSTLVSHYPLQKMLFSATLTQNPEKLAPLRLHNPVLFACRNLENHQDNKEEDAETDSKLDEEPERYILPAGLKQQMVVVEPGEKPLVVIHMLLTLKYTGVLCFTKSVEATHRLYFLLTRFKAIRVSEFSSSLTEVQRKGIIRDFRAGKLDVVVSSDAMARGMDIDNVAIVLNYDTANNVKTYVHRVGRTARAGAEGVAVTILDRKEVYHFKQMCAKLSPAVKPSVIKVSKNDLSTYEEEYQEALTALQESVAAEKKIEKSGQRRFPRRKSAKGKNNGAMS